MACTGPGIAEESIDKNRLRWHCRRGMLELDLFLGNFLDNGFEELSPADKRRFADMLNRPDQLLLDWLMGNALPADKEVLRLVDTIRSHAAD